MLSYTHQQSTPATSWVVTHNFGTAAVATDSVIFTGGNNEKILPESVIMTDVNTLTVTFSSNQTGSCRVVSG